MRRSCAEAVRHGARQVGVDPPVQLGVGGLEPQQVPIGAGLPPRDAGRRRCRSPSDSVIAAPVSALMARTTSAMNGAGQAGVLAALEHDRAEAEVAALPGAREDLVARHPVARQAVRRTRRCRSTRTRARSSCVISIRPRRWTSSPTRARRTASARCQSVSRAASSRSHQPRADVAAVQAVKRGRHAQASSADGNGASARSKMPSE